jgi:hypothetical protein
MNYYVKRDDKEYGPYSLADLQRYVQSGEVSPTDLCRSDGMTELLPVSRIVGNIPAPQTNQALGGTVYGGTGMSTRAGLANMAVPPSMHWGLLLVLSIVTCGIFSIIWIFVQAAFVKKIDPESKAQMLLLCYLGLAIGVPFLAGFLGALMHNQALASFSGLGQIGGFVCYIIAVFSMKSSLESYYNSKEPLGLQLNGVMVFFFNSIYFQYHFNEIMNTKKAMVVTA